MPLPSGFGPQSRGFNSQNSEEYLRRKRKQEDRDGEDNASSAGDAKAKKKHKIKDFTRPVSGPLSDITNGPLGPVSRKRTRDDAFEVNPDNKKNIHQYDNKSNKRRLGELLKENPPSIKDQDWGFTEAFQNRNLVNPDRQRAKDDSDVSYHSGDLSADGKLD